MDGTRFFHCEKCEDHFGVKNCGIRISYPCFNDECKKSDEQAIITTLDNYRDWQDSKGYRGK